MITDFTAKYGIKVQSDQPGCGQPARDQHGHTAGRHRPPARHLRPRHRSSPWRTPSMYAPYKAATWADIPDAEQGVHRALDQQLHRLRDDQLRRLARRHHQDRRTSPIRSTRARSPSTATRLKASAGFNGVVLAALANGGSADNIAPGVDLLQEPRRHRQPASRSTPTRARSPRARPRSSSTGRTTSAGSIATLAPKGITWKIVVPTDAPPVAAYYNEAINKDAAHPAAARCWDGVRLLGCRPEHLAEGLRPAGPPRGDAEGRDDRPGGLRRRSTRRRPPRSS